MICPVDTKSIRDKRRKMLIIALANCDEVITTDTHCGVSLGGDVVYMTNTLQVST